MNNIQSKVLKSPFVSGLFSDKQAPILYYFIIKTDNFILEHFIKSLEEFCLKRNLPVFKNIKYFENGDKYFDTLKLVSSNKEEDKDNNMTLDWFDIPKEYFRAQEIKDNGYSFISLYINPLFNFEDMSLLLYKFSYDYSMALKTKVEILFRLNGPDKNRSRMIQRIIEGLNFAYRRNSSKIEDFTSQEIDDYFTTYYLNDFNTKLKKETEFFSTSDSVKNRILKEHQYDIDKTMNAHKQIIGDQEIPCMTKIYTGTYINGLNNKEFTVFFRPSPVIQLETDFISDREHVEFIKYLSGEFFKINKLHSADLAKKQLVDIEADIAKHKDISDTKDLENLRAELLNSIAQNTDNSIKGKYAELFMKMD